MNVYEIVTNRIMALLESNQIPWKRPWKSTGAARNLITGKAYKGINQFILNCTPYQSPYWLTFRQIQAKFGSLKKGSKSELIVFYKWINTTSESPSHEEESKQDNPSCIKKIPLLRYYNVFNLEQTEGIAPPAEELPTPEFTPIEKAEQIIANMQHKPSIHHGGDRASYSPALDRICMPQKEAFHSAAGYYATFFHELSHSTGHHSRLNRKGITEPSFFGSHEYSQEELVSEFSSSMICASAGIEQETLTNSAAYIQNWLEVLKNDKHMAVIAAGQAQKSADLILGRKEESELEITE